MEILYGNWERKVLNGQELINNMDTYQITKYDYYRAAALTGLLSGVTFEPKETGELTKEDLLYLDLLCSKIANQMIQE